MRCSARWTPRACTPERLPVNIARHCALGQDQGVETIDWTGWRVLAPVAEVEAALEGEDFAHLTMINAPTDCLIAGQADACARVVEKLGRHRSVQNENEIIAHHPVMKSWEGPWREIHSRPVEPVPDIRFYSNASGGYYSPTRELVADALTEQATSGVDFRRVVNAAWEDGVRIFIEHGPRNVCSGWIRSILGEREHLAVALDRPQNGVDQLLDAVAQLIAAGVDLDTSRLVERLAASSLQHEFATEAPRHPLSFAAHYPPVALPPLGSQTNGDTQHRSTRQMTTTQLMDMTVTDFQIMEPAPQLPPVLAYYDQDFVPHTNGVANGHSGTPPKPPVPERRTPPETQVNQTPPAAPPSAAQQIPSTESVPGPHVPAPAAPQLPTTQIPTGPQPIASQSDPAGEQMVGHLTQFSAQVTAAHQKFLSMQQQAMSRLVNLYQSAIPGNEVGEAQPAASITPTQSAPPPAPVIPEVQDEVAPATPAVKPGQDEPPIVQTPIVQTPPIQKPAPSPKRPAAGRPANEAAPMPKPKPVPRRYLCKRSSRR